MRIEFGGTIPNLAFISGPGLVLIFSAATTWDPTPYIVDGYTNFDVIVIGGGGGFGGSYEGLDFNNSNKELLSYGGAGGGGGFHRLQGLLEALPTDVDIVVGGGGFNGTDVSSTSGIEYDIATTDGSDGGYSSFNYPSCASSGGKGGKRVYSATLDISPGSDGGEGGIGAETAAGHGAEGGLAGLFPPSGPNEPGTDGTDGILTGDVGEGGGGGAGGVVSRIVSPSGSRVTRMAATAGGKGSSGDETISGPRGEPITSGTGGLCQYPGSASGAKAMPLTGLLDVYGKSGKPGIVVILLTAE